MTAAQLFLAFGAVLALLYLRIVRAAPSVPRSRSRLNMHSLLRWAVPKLFRMLLWHALRVLICRNRKLRLTSCRPLICKSGSPARRCARNA